MVRALTSDKYYVITKLSPITIAFRGMFGCNNSTFRFKSNASLKSKFCNSSATRVDNTLCKRIFTNMTGAESAFSNFSLLYRSTCYIEENGAWYDNRTKEEVANLLLFRELQFSVHTFGLTGLDKLLSFMIVKELQVR